MPSNRPRRPQQEDTPASKPTKGRLNNIELAGIGLIVFAVLLFAISKCGADPVAENGEEQPTVTEEVVDSTLTPPADSSRDEGSSFSAPNRPTANTAPLTARPDSLRQPRTLYVLADSLRLRHAPELAGKVLTYLRYGEAVTDLGEATALQKLRVSADEVRTAPWVKVRTKTGKIGWAFGAYMQFYPVPRPTTEAPNN
ncbi:MAG: SH3 domain-containing protein [Aureispira sp.]